jgi:hypothetical protein
MDETILELLGQNRRGKQNVELASNKDSMLNKNQQPYNLKDNTQCPQPNYRARYDQRYNQSGSICEL